MNRTHLIVALIVLSALVAPAMACLIPGTTLTPAEAECCRQMAADCGNVPMPALGCCNTLTHSNVATATALTKIHTPDSVVMTVADAALHVTPELEISDVRIRIVEAGPPLLISPQSLSILRI